MSEQGFDGEGSGLRPERLGDGLRLRPERLGDESADRTSPREGWMLSPEGTTAGRLLQFDSVAEMQELVADLAGVLETLVARRSKAASGPITLLVFLAGHRMHDGRRGDDEP